MIYCLKRSGPAILTDRRRGKAMEQFYHESFRTTKQFPMQLRLHQGVINYAVLEHWHRSMEIDYLIDCEVQLMVGGKKTLVQSEEIILINSGDIHALWPERKIGRTQDELFGASIFISYEFLKEICPQFDEVCFVLEGNEEKKEELKHVFDEMIGIYRKEQEEFTYLKMMGLLYRMLYLLFTYFKQVKNQTIIKSQKYMERIQKVMNYVEEHYQEPVTLCQVAAHFNLSMEYLARDFKKHTGSTFREYLDKVRLNHAFELLYGTDYSMLEIAMMSGFADVRSFIKSFKKEHGMTPYQFKKRNKTGTSDRNGESFADYPHIILQDAQKKKDI